MNSRLFLTTSLLFLLLTFVTAPLRAAEFFKWYDSQGILNISDKKPSPALLKRKAVDVVSFQFKGVPVGPEVTKEELLPLRNVRTDTHRSDVFLRLDLGDKWNLENAENGSATTDTQTLVLNANKGTNIHMDRFSAPVLYQSLEGVGDFSFQVTIEYEGKNQDNSSSIILFTEDRAQWMSINFTPKGEVGWKEENGKGETIPYEEGYTTLKVFHVGDSYYFYYVLNGEWTLLRDTEGRPYDKIGLFAFSWTYEDVAARFSNVVFTVPSPADEKQNN